MKLSTLIVSFCLLFAFAGSLIVNRAVFERLPHLEDEFAYVYQARIFARGEIMVPTPPLRRATWQPFVLDVGGHRFGKYTPGWPALLAVGEMFGAPWLVNAWLSMLTVALVYRLARNLFDRSTGTVAALLVATSPTALLLSGSLMSHTAAMLCTTLLLLALWRIERGQSSAVRRGAASCALEDNLTPYLLSNRVGEEMIVERSWQKRGSGDKGKSRIVWAMLGGIALGLLILNRPWTAMGISAPLIVYSVGRVVVVFRRSVRAAWIVLQPLIVLAAVAALLALLWPGFNYATSAPRGESFPHFLVRFARGDEDTNLYGRVWTYDRPGFGEGHGHVEGGHTPALGWQHVRGDLRCAARDFFGWALPVRAGVSLENNACLTTSQGYSFVLLPLGLLLYGHRRWTWLLLAVPISLAAAYVAYWASGRIYSARYLSESIPALAIISAAGIVGMAHGGGKQQSWPHPLPPLRQRSAVGRGLRGGAFAGRVWPRLVYALLAILTLYTVILYTPARVEPLRGYGNVNQAQLDEVNRLRRTPDRPLLVIAWGDHRWRDVATLMAATSPYLDSDIILARDADQNLLLRLIAQWPDREVIYYVNGQFVTTSPLVVPGEGP